MSLINPVLFSQRFKVRAQALDAAGLLDTFLNADTKLFIDPLLFAKSSHPLIKAKGLAALRQGFTDVLDLLDVSAKPGDVAWRNAAKLMDLGETPETSLGYGGSGNSGSSRPDSLRQTILTTAKEILVLGEKNPNVIPLMGLLEEGVGPDTISDLTTNFIKPVLAEITEDFCSTNGVKTRKFSAYGNRSLPENPYRPGTPVLLVPRDVLRDLPFATDWPDVSRVVLEIQSIRDGVNRLLGDIAKASTTEKKQAVRRTALSSLKNVRAILRAIEDESDSYDEKEDLLGFYGFRQVLGIDPAPFKGVLQKPAKKDAKALSEIVHFIVDTFTDMVENNDLKDLLWTGDSPRRERASQLLFFAVANVVCAANDIDISPETNAGGGPVDFKFSTGFKGRFLVELKLSKGTVVHGYKTQLEAYKKSASTGEAMLLVIDVGGLGRKMKDVQKLKAAAEAKGEKTSAVRIVDAKRKASPSKR